MREAGVSVAANDLLGWLHEGHPIMPAHISSPLILLRNVTSSTFSISNPHGYTTWEIAWLIQ